uniref:Saposin B-type domain-containing protein n=1 Tax=Plectus sambesii TaxID=2011161 RepID=A0A914X1M9_9BILA
MKTAIAVLLAIVVAIQATPQDKKIHFLCKPCEDVFKELEKYLPEIDKLTEEALDLGVDYVCKKVTLDIPFIDHVCDKLGDEAVADLYNYILTLDHYDPTACCKHIDCC